MSEDPKKLSPYEIVLGKETWMRGVRAGMVLLVMFTLGAALLFALFSLVTGWGWQLSLLASVLVGPFVGVALFWVYWKRTQKPAS